MKKRMFLFSLGILGGLLYCCTDDNFIDEKLESEKAVDISINEIAFPKEKRERIIIKGEPIDLVEGDIHVFQGDIILSKEQIDFIKKDNDIELRGAILSDGKYKWPDGVIYYAIAPGTAEHTKRMIYQAIQIWENQSNIKIVVRNNHKDYVEFFNGEGCWSYLGRIGGKQQISIDVGWAERGNVLHEIGHAIGLLHEHSRADRDKYINVCYDNIKYGVRSSYDITKMNQYVLENHIGGNYGLDYGSIMMYGSWGGINAVDPSKPVMTKKDGSIWVADRSALSVQDLFAVAMNYGQKENPWLW